MIEVADDGPGIREEDIEHVFEPFFTTKKRGRSPGTAFLYRRGRFTLWGRHRGIRDSANSDVTFRLYDWGHVDAKTGKPRELEVDQALACIDFARMVGGLVSPVVEATTPGERERLFQCEYFWLWRLQGEAQFTVGAAGEPRCWFALRAQGKVEPQRLSYATGKGEVWLCRRKSGRAHFTRRAP